MAVFDLEAIIRLNDSGFKQGLSKAGKAVGTFAKVAGTAIAAGAAGVAALATSSVKAYADYEQLAGGVEKLFGTGGKSLAEYAKATGQTMDQAVAAHRNLIAAQNAVMRNAEQAYVSTGQSANEYLETVTGISAALINSYGGDTVQAAEQADKAMRAISDNFNTFGGDISSVQAAYQGFAKQNYTMLDNLKLGYGGTKTEMERLIADANTYREELGLTGDLTIEKYGDVVEAIDLIQQKQGIAGTTAKEAAKTISGSVSMTKAAWKNLVRAFSDKDADLSQYFSALVTSAETAFKNILPVAEQALTGIGQVITDLAPVIGEKLPELISTGLPKLVSAGTGIVTALISGIGQALPALVDALPDIWNAIKEGFVAAWPSLKEAGGKLMDMLGEGMAAADAKIAEVCANFEASMKDWASRTWEGVKAKASEAWDGIKNGVASAWDGIKTAVSTAWSKVKAAITPSTISEKVSQAWDTIKSGVSEKWDGIKAAVETAWETVTGIDWSTVEGAVSGVWSTIEGGVSGAWDGIKSAVQTAWDTVSGIDFSGIAGTISGVWSSIESGISGAWDGIKGALEKALEPIKGVLNFSWSLPEIKLPSIPTPHIEWKTKLGISYPSLSWNAKAMANPYMFTGATLFGAGEAGDEMLYGKSALMSDIREGVAKENEGLVTQLTAILDELKEYLPELSKRPVVLNSGALVGGIGYDMDRQFGDYSDMGGRELSLA